MSSRRFRNFAAAIQDYNREWSFGSTSLAEMNGSAEHWSWQRLVFYVQLWFGTVKLTLQNSTINGGSTQLRGVNSDIVLPDNLESLKVRKKDDQDALPWDEIKKPLIITGTAHLTWKPATTQPAAHGNDNTFQLIRENSEWLSKQYDKHYSLKLNKYKEEQNAIRNTKNNWKAWSN